MRNRKEFRKKPSQWDTEIEQSISLSRTDFEQKGIYIMLKIDIIHSFKA